MTRPKIYHLNDTAHVGTTLINTLRAQGIDCELIATPSPFPKSHLAKKIFGLFERFLFAFKFLAKTKYEDKILHIHFTTTALPYLFSSSPLVIHAHGSDVRIHRFNFFRHLVNLLVFARANIIFYSTPDLSRYLKRYTRRAIFLPNPVVIDSEPDQDFANKCKRILLFAHLTSIKGASISVAALQAFRQLHPDCTITVIGDSPILNRDQLNGFEVLPKLPHQAIPALVRQFGIILGQFKLGAIGMSELEAMALARPVIANFKYNQVYGGKTAIIQAATTFEIVAELEKLYNQPALQLLVGQQSRAWVQRHHDSKMIAEKLMEAYSSVHSKFPIKDKAEQSRS